MSLSPAQYPHLPPQSMVVALLQQFRERRAQENPDPAQLALIKGHALNIAAVPQQPTVWAANAPESIKRSKLCPYWTVRDGVVAVCGQLSCPHREDHRRNKILWSAAGLVRGSLHKLGHRLPFPCDGWVLRNVTSVCGRAWRTNVIQECRQLSCPDRAECLRQKKRWSDRGLVHGSQHEKKHALPKTASTVVLHCQDWVITRDGKIGICGNEFIPRKRPSQKDLDHGRDAQYGPCHPKGRNKERWERYGLHLNESVRRTCDYRKCEKGEGGTRKTFDRVKRSRSGKYYCCSAHHDAESNARKIDKAEIRGAAAMAEKLAQAEAKLEAAKGGRDQDKETPARRTLAACLALEGLAKGAMKFQMYPKQNKPKAALSNTKTFFSRHREEIETEKQRLAALPENERRIEAERARAKLAFQAELAFSTGQ